MQHLNRAGMERHTSNPAEARQVRDALAEHLVAWFSVGLRSPLPSRYPVFQNVIHGPSESLSRGRGRLTSSSKTAVESAFDAFVRKCPLCSCGTADSADRAERSWFSSLEPSGRVTPTTGAAVPCRQTVRLDTQCCQCLEWGSGGGSIGGRLGFGGQIYPGLPSRTWSCRRSQDRKGDLVPPDEGTNKRAREHAAPEGLWRS